MSKIDRRRVLATALGASAAFVGVAEAQGPDTPNIALVKSLYAAFGKGDTATIVAATATGIACTALNIGASEPNETFEEIGIDNV